MKSQDMSQIEFHIFDRICKNVFSKINHIKHNKDLTEKIIDIFESKEIFRIIEQTMSNEISVMLNTLDMVCPSLSPSYRKLAILLYLKLSTATTALLTGQKSLDNFYTLRSRLKSQIIKSGSPHSSNLLKMLGYDERKSYS